MNSIIQSPFFTILNDHIYDNKAISKSEISTAYSVFRDEVVAFMDSVADFATAYRFIGSLRIELKTLRDGISIPNCEVEKKYSLPL